MKNNPPKFWCPECKDFRFHIRVCAGKIQCVKCENRMGFVMIPLTLEFDERSTEVFDESDVLQLLINDYAWMQEQLRKHPNKNHYYARLSLRPVVWN